MFKLFEHLNKTTYVKVNLHNIRSILLRTTHVFGSCIKISRDIYVTRKRLKIWPD